MNDKSMTKEQWIEMVTKTTDPVALLEILVRFQNYLGFDRWAFVDYRIPLLAQARCIVMEAANEKSKASRTDPKAG